MSTETRTLVIRADASADIGSGHMRRCLAIAKEAKRCGVVFAASCEESLRLPAADGFEVVVLDAPMKEWGALEGETLADF